VLDKRISGFILKKLFIAIYNIGRERILIHWGIVQRQDVWLWTTKPGFESLSPRRRHSRV
jgi:hypothetical protein